MEFIKSIIDIVLHIDKYLNIVIQNFGNWSYLVLFAIVFAETGLVITPFLPGDSLLFAAGTFAAMGSFDIVLIFVTLAGAAIIGDSVNYAIGKFFGEKILQIGAGRFLKKEHIDRTHKFYEKHGGKTIVLARFIPIIRTFAPFVAGIGEMSYYKFFIYNVTGAILWVSLCVFGGYYFGNIPFIREHFTVAIFAIIILSFLPVAVEILKHRKSKKASSLPGKSAKTRTSKRSILSGIARSLRFIYTRLCRINDSPQKIAVGFGLGVFMGVMPGVGPLAALFAAFIFKVNRAAALLGGILTNTWLSIPVFFVSLSTGALITGIDPQKIYNEWSALIGDFKWTSLAQVSVFKVIAPIAIGYFFVSLVMAVITYAAVFLTIKLLKKGKRR